MEEGPEEEATDETQMKHGWGKEGIETFGCELVL
jgi:hypothetical protein